MSKSKSNIVVVALHKSGTNLIRKPVSVCGYEVAGQGIAESYSYLWVKWCMLGAAISSGYNMDSTRSELAARFFRKAYTKKGTNAIFIHWLPLGKHLRGWLTDSNPRIVFHYRDPRAITVSLYHYLLSDKMGSDPLMKMMSKIVRHLPSKEERFQFLIEGCASYFDPIRESVWLRFHPDVLSTSYESLVGSAGGGNDDIQEASLHHLLQYLGQEQMYDKALASLRDRDSRTFRTGHTDGWRSEFPEELLERFENLHGDIITALGYELLTGRNDK